MIKRLGVTKRWSDAVVFNGVASFVEVPDDKSTSPKEQITQVLSQIDLRLKECNSKRENLLQVLIYIKDLADLDELNKQWEDFIPFGHAPVRACVQANMVHSDYKIEMVITAAVNTSNEEKKEIM